MVAFELEVLAVKLDRFGWERIRNTPVHDRLLTDWMSALQDYPLDEVQAACEAAVIANPNKMPNEGHVVAEIQKARRRKVAYLPKPPEPERQSDMDASKSAAILEEVGFPVKRFGGAA